MAKGLGSTLAREKHTEGPWRVGDAGRTVFGPPNGNPSPKVIAGPLSRADARLIGAAPDMLDLLRKAHSEISDLSRDGIDNSVARAIYSLIMRVA